MEIRRSENLDRKKKALFPLISNLNLAFFFHWENRLQTTAILVPVTVITRNQIFTCYCLCVPLLEIMVIIKPTPRLCDFIKNHIYYITGVSV